MPTDIPPLAYGNFYHIYNRGNNHENIFLQERNYAYFLDLWWKHVSPITETRGVNIATQRTGALFERPFKRIPVDSTAYLMQLIVYIHQNPQKHRFAKDFREWKHSSYHQLVSETPSRLQRDRVMQLFGSRQDFVRIHHEIQPLIGLEDDE